MTEKAIEEFELDREYMNDTTSVYEKYLNILMNRTENPDKKKELIKNIEDSYVFIGRIKECIAQFNETDNKQFVKDAVDIYTTSLKPLVKTIRENKYKECYIDYDEKSNVYSLIQRKTSIPEFEYESKKSQVVKFDIKPYKVKSKESKEPKEPKESKEPKELKEKKVTKRVIIENDSDSETEGI
jgi:hypothetical protein